MKVFSGIFNKIVWFIVFVLLFGAGSVLALRFLSPPPVTTVPDKDNQPATQKKTTEVSKEQTDTETSKQDGEPTPTPTTTPSIPTTPQPVVTYSLPAVPTPFPTPSSKPESTPAATSSTSSLPALALPNQLSLNTPKKLTPGAVLSIYENLDDNATPDPINYSPISSKKVAGLTIITVKQSQFQEVSGYFLAPTTGNYAFVVSFPDNTSLDSTNLRLKIDGQPLDNVKGGNVSLEKGWHKVDLFFWDSKGYNINQIQVKWGLEGSNLKRMQTWREDS